MTIIRTCSQADIFSCDAKMRKRKNFNAMRKWECDAKKRKNSHRIASLFSLKQKKKNGKNHRSIALSHSHRITSPGEYLADLKVA
jgi:hypothetical protein